MFDALAVVVEWLWVVTEVNGAVEVGVCFHQSGRHRQRVMKAGQCGLGKFLAGAQYRLRGGP